MSGRCGAGNEEGKGLGGGEDEEEEGEGDLRWVVKRCC